MFVETLSIRNFRSFDEATIPLRRDLTILVGENNAGKSNAIDAMRLLTRPMSGRRELYCERSDFRKGTGERQVEIVATCSELTPAQQGRFISAALDTSLSKIVFGMTCVDLSSRPQPRPIYWAGGRKGAPEHGALEGIRHVYLPPLRDARQALASGNPARIYSLLRHFLGTETPEGLAKVLSRGPSNAPILKSIGEAVTSNLRSLTAGVRAQHTAIGFADDERLFDIARDLRFRMSDVGIDPEELAYSGHGYANLLYMATICVELEKLRDTDLTLFLVEEPEAHLHPQLQAAVLCFLQDAAAKSRAKDDGGTPRGELQVLVATHSPNLSAWVPGENLVVFRAALAPAAPPLKELNLTDQPEPNVDASPSPPHPSGDLPPEDDAVPSRPRHVTRCIPLAQLALEPAAWRKVNRYLDVTRSAMLFGGRVLLVEGVAEALLLPGIARKHVLKDRPEALQLFRSSVFVPIDGVDFAPYVELLLKSFGGARIADRVVVVTDGDATKGKLGEPSPGVVRRDELLKLANTLGAGADFVALTNDYTLEPELIEAGNHELLGEVFLKLHPRSERVWTHAIGLSGWERAEAIEKLFKSTRKGDFAHLLAERIELGAHFETPSYIRLAIEALVK